MEARSNANADCNINPYTASIKMSKGMGKVGKAMSNANTDCNINPYTASLKMGKNGKGMGKVVGRQGVMLIQTVI